MTSFIFRETMMSHLLLWGNAYAQILRDGRGRVLRLYPLLPDKMKVSRDSRTGELYYTYTRSTEENPNFTDKGQIQLRREDVLHIPGLGFDGLVGYSPIAMAKNAIGITKSVSRFARNTVDSLQNVRKLKEKRCRDLLRKREHLDAQHARRCFMRENDTKVIGSMRRESLVYKGFQRFSALEVIRFLTMFTDFLFDGNSTYWQGGQTV